MKNTFIFLVLILFIQSCSKKEGCTDIFALNFDYDAEIDDGSCIYPSEPDQVYIYSVTDSPTDEEKVTLKNNSGDIQDISNWTIGDSNDPNAYNIPDGTILNDQDFLTFWASTMGFGINNSDETIFLKNSSGSTIDTWSN